MFSIQIYARGGRKLGEVQVNLGPSERIFHTGISEPIIAVD